ERRRLVVAALREARERLLPEYVNAAADPVRNTGTLVEALHEIGLAELDDAERREGPRDGDGRRRTRPSVPLEQRRQIDVEQLVPVQRVDVTLLAPSTGCEAQPPS